jgi:hypothetical protein
MIDIVASARRRGRGAAALQQRGLPSVYIGRCLPNCALEILIYSLTGNAPSPFHAETTSQSPLGWPSNQYVIVGIIPGAGWSILETLGFEGKHPTLT